LADDKACCLDSGLASIAEPDANIEGFSSTKRESRIITIYIIGIAKNTK
jgi:hypothetical protein